MPRFASVRTVIIAAFVLVAGSRAFSAEDYAIKLARADKVGMVEKIKGTYTTHYSVVVTADGKKVKEDSKESTVVVEGEQKILEVAANALASKVSFKVDKCQIIEGGQTTDIVPAGKTIEVTHEPGKKLSTYTVDGTALPDPMAEKLKHFVTVHDPKKPTDDETYGTNARKKVGDTWEPRMDQFLQTLDIANEPIKKEAITAKIKLAEVKSIGGVPSMALEFVVEMPMTQGKMPDAPEWLQIQSGKIAATVTTMMPVDVSGRPQSQTEQMTMSMEMSGTAPDGGPAVVSKVTSTMNAEVTAEIVK